MNRIVMLAAAAALIAAPAFAAKTEHATVKHTATATTLHYMAGNGTDLWRTSEIRGVDVYNDMNQKIGTVDDVLMDPHGSVKGVVIGVGGFLGVGERNIAVPFNELHWQMDNAGNTTRTANGQATTHTTNQGVAQNNTDHHMRAMLPGVTKDQLEKAPEFKYAG